ncbi:DUF2742 domain-containing protein [Gordonia jacobaea]|uniref:DUF2742 domain-containing protein n=1 Tax=Gordonia jacobaea TaxID=122202 RepID=UPI0022DFA46E|nr:DUF2742 domain-containing protein [Gordonia jacobaea]
MTHADDQRPYVPKADASRQEISNPNLADPYVAVRNWVQWTVGSAGGSAPAAGSATWCALPDDHPAKFVSVLIAGTRWVLEQELDRIDERRRVLKSAAEEVAQARDWAVVAKRIRLRDEWIRSNPWVNRRIA